MVYIKNISDSTISRSYTNGSPIPPGGVKTIDKSIFEIMQDRQFLIDWGILRIGNVSAMDINEAYGEVNLRDKRSPVVMSDITVNGDTVSAPAITVKDGLQVPDDPDTVVLLSPLTEIGYPAPLIQVIVNIADAALMGYALSAVKLNTYEPVFTEITTEPAYLIVDSPDGGSATYTVMDSGVVSVRSKDIEPHPGEDPKEEYLDTDQRPNVMYPGIEVDLSNLESQAFRIGEVSTVEVVSNVDFVTESDFYPDIKTSPSNKNELIVDLSDFNELALIRPTRLKCKNFTDEVFNPYVRVIQPIAIANDDGSGNIYYAAPTGDDTGHVFFKVMDDDWEVTSDSTVATFTPSSGSAGDLLKVTYPDSERTDDIVFTVTSGDRSMDVTISAPSVSG